MENLIGAVVKLCNTEPNAPLTDTQNAILRKHVTDVFSQLRVTPDHPPYAWMIEKALQELNEKGGSSEESISDFIKNEHKSLPWAHRTMLKHHLQKMTDQGEILMINGRFLLPGDSESVNPKRKRKRKCTKRKKRGNSKIKQKSVQMEKENKLVQHDDVEAVREQKDLDEQKSKANEAYRELNEHHNEPSTDKEDGQLSGQQNDVTGNKVFHRRVLRSTVHKQKGKELFDATEGSLQSFVAIGSGIGSTPFEPPRFMMTEETAHLQDLESHQSKLSITTVEETAGDNLPQLLSPEAPPDFEFLALEDATANKAHTFSSIGLDLPKEDRVMHQSSDRPSKEEAAAEDLLKTEKQQKKHHGWQLTNRPITRAQAKGTVTPNEQSISGRNRTQVKLAMESSSEPKQPSIENSTETARAQRQLKRWSKNPGEPKSVSTSKVEPLALCDSADQQLVLVEEPLSIQILEPLALAISEEAMNLTDPQYEVRLKQPKDKRRKKALKDKDDGTDSDTILLKDMRSTKKLAKKKNDRGGGRRRNAH